MGLDGLRHKYLREGALALLGLEPILIHYESRGYRTLKINYIRARLISFVKYDQDDAHVVAADATVGVLGDKLLEQVFHYGFVVLLGFDQLFRPIYKSLAVIYVPLPYPITPYQDKLIDSFLSFYLFYIRFARYHLLTIRKVLVPFIVEISERTR